MKFLDRFAKHVIRNPHAGSRRDAGAQPAASAGATTSKIDPLQSELITELGLPDLLPALPPTDPVSLLEQRIEEACLLHASRQSAAAAELLAEATSATLPQAAERERLAWLMRLELAALNADRQQFDDIALAYAQRFETSPPQWCDPQDDHDAQTEPLPLLSIRGRLDGDAGPMLTQVEQRAAMYPRFRLDLSGLTAMEDDGCQLLLLLLQRWHTGGIEVCICNAGPIVELLRARLHAGTHDSKHAAWLLLIELLRIGEDPAAHEEACLAYSQMFDISPPVALPACIQGDAMPGRVVLPAEIRLPLDNLLTAIGSASHDACLLILDCARLQRLDFNAASPLLSGIARVTNGKPVEWRDPPFLVSTLLQLLSGERNLRIVNRKS